MPTDSFWEGVSHSVEKASGDILVAAAIVVGIVYIYARYIYPERLKDKEATRSLQQKQFELQQKAQQDNIDVQRQNIESRATQMQILASMSDTMKVIASSQDKIETNQAVIIAQMNDSKMNSSKIGDKMQSAVDDLYVVKSKVNDIHSEMFK